MLLTVMFLAWGASLLSQYRVFFTFLFGIGMFLQLLAWFPLTAPLMYALGWPDPKVITATGDTVVWDEENGFRKIAVLEVTNHSDNYYSVFFLSCQTTKGRIRLYDKSGMSPYETGPRAYVIEDTGIYNVTKCKTDRPPTRGKPSSYHSSYPEDRTPWGDRLPLSLAADFATD